MLPWFESDDGEGGWAWQMPDWEEGLGDAKPGGPSGLRTKWRSSLVLAPKLVLKLLQSN